LLKEEYLYPLGDHCTPHYLASLLRYSELLYDFYDHQDLVRELLELCCERLIKARNDGGGRSSTELKLY